MFASHCRLWSHELTLCLLSFFLFFNGNKITRFSYYFSASPSLSSTVRCLVCPVLFTTRLWLLHSDGKLKDDFQACARKLLPHCLYCVQRKDGDHSTLKDHITAYTFGNIYCLFSGPIWVSQLHYVQFIYTCLFCQIWNLTAKRWCKQYITNSSNHKMPCGSPDATWVSLSLRLTSVSIPRKIARLIVENIDIPLLSPHLNYQSPMIYHSR